MRAGIINVPGIEDFSLDYFTKKHELVFSFKRRATTQQLKNEASKSPPACHTQMHEGGDKKRWGGR